VIATGIETSHVEVPMIVRNYQQVSLHQFTFASSEVSHRAFLVAETVTGRQFFSQMPREFFVKSNETIRIMRLVQRLQPFRICVPFAEPRSAVAAGKDQVWIFEDLQR
jgi:hypothetical protein